MKDTISLCLLTAILLLVAHAVGAQDDVPRKLGANAPEGGVQLLAATKVQDELAITLQHVEVLQTENAALKTKSALLEAEREENEEMKVAFEEIRAELAAIKSHTGYAANKAPIATIAATFLHALTGKNPETARPCSAPGAAPAVQEEHVKP